MIIVPWSPFGSIPPGQGSAGAENDAYSTYPFAGARIGVSNGI